MLVKNLYLHIVFLVYILALEHSLYYSNLYFFLSLFAFFLLLFYVLNQGVIYRVYQKYWTPVILLSVYISLSSAFYQDFILQVKGLFIIIVFYVCYILYKKKIDFIIYFLRLMYVFALISYAIQINNGEFLFWSFLFLRNSSVFFDPNYASALFALSAILSLIVIKNTKFKLISFLFFLGALFFTYSKGGMLGLLLGIVVLLYTRYSYKFVPILIILALLIVLAFTYIDVDLERFRFVQGFNKRDEFFFRTIEHVFVQMNIFGGNSEIISEVVFGNKYETASTHNYYLDLLLTNGVIPFVFLFVILINVFYNGIVYKNEYFAVFVLLLVISNSISISIGGIGILSFIYTYAIVSILNKK